MKKLISLFLPMAIIFSLAGCQLDTETVYIKKDLRKIVKYHDGTKNQVDGIPPRYEVRIDGNWYHADESEVPSESGCGFRQGDKACNFTMIDQNGDRVELYQFAGKYIVLDLFAEW